MYICTANRFFLVCPLYEPLLWLFAQRGAWNQQCSQVFMNMLKPEYQYLRDRICYWTLLCIFTSRSFLPFSLFFICTFHNKHVNGALLIDSHFYRAFFFLLLINAIVLGYAHLASVSYILTLSYLTFFFFSICKPVRQINFLSQQKEKESKKKKEVKNGVILPTVRNRCTIRVRRLVLIWITHFNIRTRLLYICLMWASSFGNPIITIPNPSGKRAVRVGISWSFEVRTILPLLPGWRGGPVRLYYKASLPPTITRAPIR